MSGLGGVVEGCDRSPWQGANLSQPPRVQGRRPSPGIETPSGCKQRDPPSWRVSRFATVANSAGGLPAQTLTRSAIPVSIQLLHAVDVEEVAGLCAIGHPVVGGCKIILDTFGRDLSLISI